MNDKIYKELEANFIDHKVNLETYDQNNKCLDLREYDAHGVPLFAHRIYYIIKDNTLFVNGDYYPAVYRWTSPISFEFLAGCELGYFASKCDASPEGREYRSWKADKAKKEFDDWVNRHVELMTKEERSEWEEKWRGVMEDAESNMSCQHEWTIFYHDNYNFFTEGLDDCDYNLAGIGMDIDYCCMMHWMGLRVAMKKLEVK